MVIVAASSLALHFAVSRGAEVDCGPGAGPVDCWAPPHCSSLNRSGPRLPVQVSFLSLPIASKTRCVVDDSVLFSRKAHSQNVAPRSGTFYICFSILFCLKIRMGWMHMVGVASTRIHWPPWWSEAAVLPGGLCTGCPGAGGSIQLVCRGTRLLLSVRCAPPVLLSAICESCLASLMLDAARARPWVSI